MLSSLKAAQRCAQPDNLKYFKERDYELWHINLRRLSNHGIVHEPPYIDLEDHTATMFVHVGKDIFNHSKAKLEFFSTSIREQVKRQPKRLNLRNIDPYAWEIFTTFMITYDLDARLAGLHGAELTCRDGVSLLVKVWLMAQQLGGACTLLQNLCFARIMMEFVTPEGIVHSIPNPRDVEFALMQTEYCVRPQPLLIMFYVGLLGWDGMEEKMKVTPEAKKSWSAVLERFLTFGCLLEGQREMVRRRPEMGRRPIRVLRYLATLDIAPLD